MGKAAQQFVKSLQQMIRNNQREEIAKRINYPLTVDRKGSVPDEATFSSRMTPYSPSPSRIACKSKTRVMKYR